MAYEFYVTNKHYHTLDYYLKSKYQKKVFKIPLNASFTCPNRDGSKGIGGCAFCSALGSGDFAGNPQDRLLKQFDEVKKIMEKKWNDGYYIVYFQAFSNTYASIQTLKNCFEPFINKENVIGMSIATRCDCINEEVITYLKELKKHFKEFWIELGLQSTNSKTSKQMNLCYNFNDFKKAVRMLNLANIDVIAHIIDGLPNEDEKIMLKTIKDINTLPIKGLKIHCLNVILNSRLGKDYLNQPFKILSKDEYINIVIKQLLYLRDDIIIHRIGADSKEENLIAPKWVLKKFSIIDEIDKIMDENDYFQGDLY